MGRARLRNPLILLGGLLGLLLVLAVGAYAYDHSRRDQIAKGVRIEGIDVGGLSSSAAAARLERTVVASMERPVVVSTQGRSWQLTPRQAGVTVDVDGTVAEAVRASRTGSIFSRTWRGLSGGSVSKDVSLQVSYSHRALGSFAAQVGAALDKAPQDATVEPGPSGLTQIADRVGFTVDEKLLRARVGRALRGPFVKRTIAVPAHTVEPGVTTNELAAQYPAYIVVNRAKFELLFYQHLELTSTYQIAVGMQGLETTPGLYHVQWKQTDPPWYVPHSPWAGKLAGKVIPPGPEDPLKARFMAFNGGAGIHGIAPSEYGSIGHDASHGCVRMRIPDVIALYSRTPVGTPVYVI
jgi:lipoprotein-anchoring transpeptidase ErfK/SrfK